VIWGQGHNILLDLLGLLLTVGVASWLGGWVGRWASNYGLWTGFAVGMVVGFAGALGVRSARVWVIRAMRS